MKTVTFYSYKGGVGRSLALANVATRLSEFGKKVCIIDFDIEAPGLQFKFKNNVKKFFVNKGLVDYICDFRDKKVFPDSLKEYSTTIEFGSKKQLPITLIPAGNIENNEYWQNLSSIHWNDFFYNEDSNGVRFFLDLKERIQKEFNPDFILIDSRTGITEIAGITISLLADEVVIVSANNDENLFGCTQIIKSISNTENIISNKTPKIHFVLSRIPFNINNEPEKHKQHLLELKVLNRINGRERKHLISDVLFIHSDRDLEENESLKIGNESQQISKDYLELFKRITEDILTPEDLKKFDDIKQSENFLGLALKENDRFFKRKHLFNSIEKNPDNIDALFEISKLFYETNKYDDSISYLYRLLNTNPNFADAYFYLGLIHGNENFVNHDYNKAIEFYFKYLEINPTSSPANENIAVNYSNLLKYDEAFHFYNEAIKFDPNNYRAYNGIACLYLEKKEYNLAFDNIQKSISINPNFGYSYGTLAEIYGDMNKEFEFLLNIDIALSKDVNLFTGIKEFPYIYKNFIENEKFIEILDKYDYEYEQVKSTIESHS